MHDRKREEMTEAAKKQLMVKIAAYRELYEKCLEMRKKKIYSETALKTLDKVLMINPEFYTMWNYRKEILMHLLSKPPHIVGSGGVHDGVCETPESLNRRYITKDLKLNEACIESRDVKSYGTWEHRRWLFRNLKCTETKTTLLKRDLQLCATLLKADERNFHCWGYRMFVTNILREMGKYDDEAEMKFANSCAETNFSNYSAWHARAKIISKQPAGDDKNTTINNELDLLSNAFYTCPNDQSGWIYADWLVSESTSDESSSKVAEAAQELLEDDPSQKWPRLALITKDTTSETKKDQFAKLQEVDPMRSGYYVDAQKA
eukprot:TRINITY_DN10547_c0_g1_i1.p1 TRINITY_DN10547_c0_g1~~TRINITY_DN10547_c0_g1_i1.p1  ORF type:complete len:337 (+),score=61.60 TRINITY_DN10547_c0_g1_i1:56-1012(+)